MTPKKIAAVRRAIENDRKSCLEQLDNYATDMIETMGLIRRRVKESQPAGVFAVGYIASPLQTAADVQRLLVKLQAVEERAKELAWLTDATKK